MLTSVTRVFFAVVREHYTFNNHCSRIRRVCVVLHHYFENKKVTQATTRNAPGLFDSGAEAVTSDTLRQLLQSLSTYTSLALMPG